MKHFTWQGRYMGYSASKVASVKPGQKFKPYFIVWGLLMQCWKHQRDAQKTVSFPTCTSMWKAEFVRSPSKMIVECGGNYKFLFPEVIIADWPQTPTELYVPVPIAVCITVSANITVPCSLFSHSCRLCLQHQGDRKEVAGRRIAEQ